jgi:hypothetical protein
VGEHPTRRREGDHRLGEIGNRFHRLDDGFGAQHHSRAATKGRVIDTAVWIGGGVAKIVQV